MAYAVKNVPLTVSIPKEPFAQVVTFASVATAGDGFRIPRRYPFVDIKNYDALVSAGYLRHGLKQNKSGTTSKAVSTELGGSATTNTEGVLGYQLPNTEKLVLLVKVNTTLVADATIKFLGSEEYRIADETLTIASGATAGTVYEIPLFDFGLFINGQNANNPEHAGLIFEVSSTSLDVALVARVA